MAVVSGQELWQWRSIALQQAQQVDVPTIEVDWLLREVAGLNSLALRLGSVKDLPEVPLQVSLPELDHLWQQRLQQRVPVQYLAGVAPWRQFTLQVSPAVLIPRPETEQLIDLVIDRAKGRPEIAMGDWADLGTGSGAIALGLADAFPAATLHAVDYSAAALAIAEQNAQHLGLADRIRFYQGSWFEPLSSLKGHLSGIVSNPPYIPSSLLADLQPEVAHHEPRLALDGGADGLDSIRHLVNMAPDYLQPGGIWLIEMMAGQAEAVLQLLQTQGSYDQMRVFPDLAGIDRFGWAVRR